MSSSSTQVDLIIKKPVALLNRELNISWKELFLGLGKVAMFSVLGERKDVWESSIDTLKAIGLGQSEENIAWKLVSKAFFQALHDLIEDYQDLFNQPLTDEVLADLAERVEHTMNSVEVEIDASFFEAPQNLSLLDDFKSALMFWLKGLGFDEFQAEAFHYRLRGQFILALHKEWRSDAETYAGLLSKLDTPFTQATLNQRSKLQYNAWLQKQANERVFSEAFGLCRVYIPLRAYFIEKPKSKNSDEPIKRIVVDLHTEIQSWIERFDADDAIRVISGGPGSGKSSFSKVLAADLAAMSEVPVLFIPLHHFNINDSLIKAVEQFVYQDPILRISPLDAKEGEKRLLIIFDGLDELSMQGKAADATARDFVDEVINTLSRFNGHDMKWQALITGRDLSVQASETRLRNRKQITYLLPYYLDLEDSEVQEKNYQDTNNILRIDQRHQWWQLFGKAKGTIYSSLPGELTIDSLKPITTEPLLNYLVALSYERKKIDFNEDLSLNTIYYDLLEAVYERKYAGCHTNVKNLTFEEFLAILEEIALAVWHGNGRTASESYLIERCKDAGLDNYLKRYSENAKTGVVRLLTAFYFRQFGTESNNDRTFEFTHKSFREYLTARQIVGLLNNICEERTRNKNNPRQGWSIDQALVEWIKCCGLSQLTYYEYYFLQKEMTLEKEQNVLKIWKHTLHEMAIHSISYGMPMEKIPNLKFLDMYDSSIMAEYSLMCTLYFIMHREDSLIPVAWNHPQLVREWKVRSNLTSFLYALDFSKQEFFWCSFDYAELIKTSFQNSSFFRVSFNYATLCQCDFSNAFFRETNFEGANLQNANLEGATFIDVNFRNANLKGTILEGKNWREITGYIEENDDLEDEEVPTE